MMYNKENKRGVKMRQEIKDFIKDCRKSILFYTFVYVILFSKIVVNVFGFEYRQYVNYFSILVIILGIILGVIQKFIISKSKSTRICIIICTISVIIVCCMFYNFILLIVGFSLKPEHVVEKDGKKYVAYVYSWLDTRVEYYNYINFLIRGGTKRIEENYYNVGRDVLAEEVKGKYTCDYTYYYDENGKVISTNNTKQPVILDSNKQETNREEVKTEDSNTRYIAEDDVLYEKIVNENIRIRVVNLGAILAQRSIIDIEKSTDNGKTYIGQSEEGITIHNGAEFVFIDEDIGFINDPGLAGTNGENRGLLVTTDGGKTFKNANITHPNSIEEKNLFVKGIPYIEDGILKVEIYTINHSKYPEKTYYEFSSNDNGVTWEYK